MKPTIYIAGPMRGRPDFNRAAFNAATERLAARGWQPINPVDIEKIYPCVDEDGHVCRGRLLDLMAVERAFVAHVNAVYLLDGWEASEGVRAELRAFYDDGGFLVFLESNGTPDARGERNGTPDVIMEGSGTK